GSLPKAGSHRFAALSTGNRLGGGMSKQVQVLRSVEWSRIERSKRFVLKRALALDEAALRSIAAVAKVKRTADYSQPHHVFAMLSQAYRQGLEDRLNHLFEVCKEILAFFDVKQDSRIWEQIYESQFRPEISRHASLVMKHLERELSNHGCSDDLLLAPHRDE